MRGAVAAGHEVTAQAAADIIAAGGNAFDAVTAAIWAACVAEPVLASLGGGGFLMARPAGKPPQIYDFFVETPLEKRPAEDLDFRKCVATFSGGVEQVFYGGYGAVATPGVIAGLFAIHRDLCGMPMAELAAPAQIAARDGVIIDDYARYVMSIVTPLLALSADSRTVFGQENRRFPDDFAILGTGARQKQPDLAQTIDYLVAHGADGFYRGELGRNLIAQCRELGGYLTEKDLAAYRVLVRDPLLVAGRKGRFVLNAPPASGGVLVGFGLKLARELDLEDFGSLRHLEMLSQILQTTGVVRDQYGAAPIILADEFCEGYRTLIGDRPLSQNGTTHISVVDAAGNLASATISNGSTSGMMIPGTGIMLNNMLGEEDLSTDGLHRWPCGVRMTSMMTPALYLGGEGKSVALGSGGSSRIRSTMMQALMNLDMFDMDIAQAIAAPRMHVENDLLSIEPGFDPALLDCLTIANQQRWQETDMFFGGVHAASITEGNFGLEAFGDVRRNGCNLIVA